MCYNVGRFGRPHKLTLEGTMPRNVAFHKAVKGKHDEFSRKALRMIFRYIAS